MNEYAVQGIGTCADIHVARSNKMKGNDAVVEISVDGAWDIDKI